MNSSSSNHPTAARLASFIAAYIECDIKLHNAVRGAFDSMDSYQRGGAYIRHTSGTGHWFNKKNFRKSAVVDLCLSPEFPFVSPQARTWLQDFKSKSFEGDIEVICEHSIPVSALEAKLKEHHKREKLSAESVLNFHRSYYRRAIITRSEDRTLNQNGLRRRMPQDDWDTAEGRPFARYHEVGFLWAEDWR